MVRSLTAGALRWVRARGTVWSYGLEVAGVGGLTWAAWTGIAPAVGVTLASVYVIIVANWRR